MRYILGLKEDMFELYYGDWSLDLLPNAIIIIYVLYIPIWPSSHIHIKSI